MSWLGSVGHGEEGSFSHMGRNLGEVLIILLKEHELKFNVTAINSKHRSYPLTQFLARIFLLSTLQGWGISFTVNT